MLTVVTGATGQVGLHLVDELLSRGRRVRAFLLPGDRGLDRREGVEVVHGDVRDRASLDAAFEGADTVHHLAAVVSTSSDPGPILDEVNIDGAANAAGAARQAGARRFVHYSSMVVFDPDPRHQPLDEDRRRVRGGAPYTRSKVRGEEAVREEVAQGLDAVVVHPTVIVGPHETHHAGIVQGLIAKHQRGELPAAMGGGGFNLVDVLDVVEGALLAEDRGRSGESYLLGGHWYEFLDLVAVASASCGRRAPLFTVPVELAAASLPLVQLGSKLLGMDAPFDAESLAQLRGNREISTAKAAQELGYAPRPIDDAVARVHAWLDDV